MLTPEVRPRTTQPAKLQIERTTAPKPLPPSANLKFGHNFVSPPLRARARASIVADGRRDGLLNGVEHRRTTC